MVSCKRWTYVLSFLCFIICLRAPAADFQGVLLPENTSVVLAVIGEGAQIYESKSKASGVYEWALKAPEAELKSLSGEVIGKHFGGPTWALSDGSQVVGTVPPLKSQNSPEGRNIAWLLLAAKSRSDTGMLSKVDYVVRIATSGGVAPAEAPKSETDMARINYRAIYLFLRKQSP
jgi:Protein of unknown function (DUF3455)